MNPKDLFSSHSKEYASFRPTYPADLYQFIYAHCQSFERAWDCATGNGQAAVDLSLRFHQVFATDLSERQIEHAQRKGNIVYSVSKAEATSFADASFDLITVAQAVHWVAFDAFYMEVKRVAKPNALIAIWGYSLLSVNEKIDPLINDFYVNIIGPYWDQERKLIDQLYQTIPFPFKEISSPKFEMTFEWTLAELEGYLNTWSAVRKFIKTNNFNPVDKLIESIYPLWKQTRFTIRFPLFLRLGIVEK